MVIAALGSLLATGASAEVAAAVRYDVLPVRSTLAEDDAVGSIRSGLACVRSGTLRWSAFAMDGARRAAEAAATLTNGGVPATAADPALALLTKEAPLAISVEITALSVDLCRPQWGMLKLGGVRQKGSGNIAVRWRVIDRSSRAIAIDRTVTASFAFKTAERDPGAILRAGLAANADRFASELKSSAGS